MQDECISIGTDHRRLSMYDRTSESKRLTIERMHSRACSLAPFGVVDQVWTSGMTLLCGMGLLRTALEALGDNSLSYI